MQQEGSELPLRAAASIKQMAKTLTKTNTNATNSTLPLPPTPNKQHQHTHTQTDADSGMILAEGVSRLCDDLGVDPSDVATLALSWRLGAATMCEYSRDEFVGGLQRLGADSLEALKRKLPELRNDLNDPERWREIYNYAFGWAKEKGQKCLQLDVALGMWQLLFDGARGGEAAPWPHAAAWCDFLQKHHGRAVSRDTWAQLFEFARSVRPDFSDFDESAAWPYLIDEFVEHMRAQQQQSGGAAAAE